MNSRLLVLVITGLLLLLAVPLAQAGICGCEPVEEVDSVNIEAACDHLTVSWSHGSGAESAILVVNGDTIEFLALEFFDAPNGSLSLDFDPPLDRGTSLVIIIVIIDQTEELVAESFFEIHCDLPESPQTCTDGRITYTLCQPLVVYPVVSEDGIGWTVYQYVRDAEMGDYMFYVPAERFDALPDAPAANCTVDSSANGEVVLHLLTSGQYQFNVGPDEEGKVFVYIFNNLLSPPVSIDTYISGLPLEVLSACI